jgi:hypothetical protein
MGRFETKWLSRSENLAALADLPGQRIDKVPQRRPPKMIVQAEQRVSGPRRSQLAVSTTRCGRDARFVVAQDARRSDRGPATARNPGTVG